MIKLLEIEVRLFMTILGQLIPKIMNYYFQSNQKLIFNNMDLIFIKKKISVLCHSTQTLIVLIMKMKKIRIKN